MLYFFFLYNRIVLFVVFVIFFKVFLVGDGLMYVFIFFDNLVIRVLLFKSDFKIYSYIL